MADEPTAAAPEPTAVPTATPGTAPIPAPEPTPTPEPTPEPAAFENWRNSLTDPDVKKFAETSPDLNHLVDRFSDMRNRLSTAIVPPGKDAQPEEVAAYHKRIGVPAAAEDYVFAMPEGHEPSDTDKAFQSHMAKVLYEAEIPADKAALLTAGLNQFTLDEMKRTQAEDKKYSDDGEAVLRQDWPGEEYAKNQEMAQRAFKGYFGDQSEDARQIEMKDGRFLMDNPIVLRAFAAIGRDMLTGQNQPPMPTDAREAAQDEVTDLRARSSKALAEGNTREANRLYQKEMELVGKIGPAPVAA